MSGRHQLIRAALVATGVVAVALYFSTGDGDPLNGVVAGLAVGVTLLAAAWLVDVLARRRR